MIPLDKRRRQFRLRELLLITALIAAFLAMITGRLGEVFQAVAQAVAIVAIASLPIIFSYRFAVWYDRMNDDSK